MDNIKIDSNSCVMDLIPPQPKRRKEQTCEYCGSNYIELTLSGQCKNCNAFIF